MAWCKEFARRLGSNRPPPSALSIGVSAVYGASMLAVLLSHTPLTWRLIAVGMLWAGWARSRRVEAALPTKFDADKWVEDGPNFGSVAVGDNVLWSSANQPRNVYWLTDSNSAARLRRRLRASLRNGARVQGRAQRDV